VELDPRIVSSIQEVLIGLIQILALILATYAAKYVKAHVSAKQMDLAMSVAQIAVQAVEQLAASKQIDLKDKYSKALMLARDGAAKYGLKFTDDQWEQLIEAAVKSMKDAGEEIVSAPEAPTA
jgi:PIN domain nuclease of toxin-antitoxin system